MRYKPPLSERFSDFFNSDRLAVFMWWVGIFIALFILFVV